MDEAGRELLERIIACPSPTGDEQQLQRMIREYASEFADAIEPDLHGNLGILLNPRAPRKVMLAAHCDTIGFLVMDIGDDGFIRVDPLGGADEQAVPGTRVVIHGERGEVPGIFGKVATHNQGSSEREKTPSIADAWIDIGATSREDAEELVRIGDYVTFEARVQDLRNGRVAAPGLDNGAGLWTILEVARRCAQEELDIALYCVSTVQEEIGSRGAESAANRISPVIAISVDTTLAIDDPGMPSKRTTPKLALGKGPSISMGPNTNVVVADLLVGAARARDLPFQREPNADVESNDAKPLQVGDGGAAAASIGIPIRNMHTPVEVMSLSDLEATADLLTEFVLRLKDDTDLLPINMHRSSVAFAGGRGNR
ncbi:MAG TPA: hypothetical protein VD997_05020 [Phycisphaerales bacterium]|nr:hypothetical protein [Phycisphaerales bacterium]